MQRPFLIGPRLYLRPLELEDAPALADWFNNPEVTRFLQRSHPMSLLAEQDWIRLRQAGNESEVTLGMALRADDLFIGCLGLHRLDNRSRQSCLGITIGSREHWGQGYGSEALGLLVRHAFETLILNRVWLEVFEYNTRGIRAYEKVGFRHEGRLRQATFREGRYWDVLVMGLLRAEWPGAAERPAFLSPS